MRNRVKEPIGYRYANATKKKEFKPGIRARVRKSQKQEFSPVVCFIRRISTNSAKLQKNKSNSPEGYQKMRTHFSSTRGIESERVGEVGCQ